MKITTIILILLCASFTSIAIATNDSSNKQLNRDLKRQLKTENYVLEMLEVPGKYTVNGKFYQITEKSQNQNLGYVYIGRIFTVRSSGNRNSSSGSSEYFDYFILYNSAKVVEMVKVFNYQASHGVNITAAGWLKQFVGYQIPKPLEVGKQVDAISGATISVNNITHDIKAKTHILNEIKK